VKKKTQRYNKPALDFMDKVVEISGLGDRTFLPDAVKVGVTKPVEVTMAGARAETELVMFSCVERLMQRTGLKPTDFDALIVNNTSFNPVPSLSAAVVNKFKMRKDIRSFTLCGMGCAASVIAVDLARDILSSSPNTRVVSRERFFFFFEDRDETSEIKKKTHSPPSLTRILFTFPLPSPARHGERKHPLEHVRFSSSLFLRFGRGWGGGDISKTKREKLTSFPQPSSLSSPSPFLYPPPSPP